MKELRVQFVGKSLAEPRSRTADKIYETYLAELKKEGLLEWCELNLANSQSKQ